MQWVGRAGLGEVFGLSLDIGLARMLRWSSSPGNCSPTKKDIFIRVLLPTQKNAVRRSHSLSALALACGLLTAGLWSPATANAATVTQIHDVDVFVLDSTQITLDLAGDDPVEDYDTTLTSFDQSGGTLMGRRIDLDDTPEFNPDSTEDAVARTDIGLYGADGTSGLPTYLSLRGVSSVETGLSSHFREASTLIQLDLQIDEWVEMSLGPRDEYSLPYNQSSDSYGTTSGIMTWSLTDLDAAESIFNENVPSNGEKSIILEPSTYRFLLETHSESSGFTDHLVSVNEEMTFTSAVPEPQHTVMAFGLAALAALGLCRTWRVKKSGSSIPKRD